MKNQLTWAALSLALAAPAAAGGGISLTQKIDDEQGGLLPVLADGDAFGAAVSSLGDIDGNGVPDLAVGIPASDLSGTDSGRVRVLLMNADGTVASEGGISGFDLVPQLGNIVNMGRAVAGLGDVDGDGVGDVAVSVSHTVVNAIDAFLVVLLHPGGTYKSHTLVQVGGGFEWGTALTGLDDLDGNGAPDLATGNPLAVGTSTGDASGTVTTFLLDSAGATVSSRNISEGVNGFGGDLDPGDEFGASVAMLTDVDGDGDQDLVVGAPGDDDGGADAGAVWVLYLYPDGSVKGEDKISATSGDGPALSAGTRFGSSVADVGDFDGDGVTDLLVGSDEGDGRFWLLFLEPWGAVRSTLEYDHTWAGAGSAEDYAADLTTMDLDGDGTLEIVAGAPASDGGGVDRGGLYVLWHDGVSAAQRANYGCDHNVVKSLLSYDLPRLGTTMDLLLDNPLDTQTAGATFPIWFASLDTSIAAPACGPGIPGWNMDPSKANGELVALPNWVYVSDVGPVWNGAAVEMQLPIPDAPALMGLEAVIQGLLVDVAPGAPIPYGLTRALLLTLGV